MAKIRWDYIWSRWWLCWMVLYGMLCSLLTISCDCRSVSKRVELCGMTNVEKGLLNSMVLLAGLNMRTGWTLSFVSECSIIKSWIPDHLCSVLFKSTMSFRSLMKACGQRQPPRLWRYDITFSPSLSHPSFLFSLYHIPMPLLSLFSSLL